MLKKLNRALIHALPKAELHCHLDGSLRVQTVIELAAEQGLPLPAYTADALKPHLSVSMAGGNLESYLKVFDITTSVLQYPEALYRVTYELAQDCAGEHIRYLEIRFSPILHIQKGMRMNEALEAVLKAKTQAEKDLNIVIGIIICSIRHMDPASSLSLAELCVAYKNRGVVGFDLAGAEENFPAKDHREAFYLIINNNINTTVHAGEAYGPRSIHQALHYISANRLGHGTRLQEDEDLLNYVNDQRIPLEMCLTSNVHTGAVNSMAEHPIRRYFDAGIRVTLNTDNRLVSSTTLTDEYMIAIEQFGVTIDELKYLLLNGFKSAFLPYRQKVELIQRITDEMEEKGLIIRKDYI